MSIPWTNCADFAWPMCRIEMRFFRDRPAVRETSRQRGQVQRVLWLSVALVAEGVAIVGCIAVLWVTHSPFAARQSAGFEAFHRRSIELARDHSSNWGHLAHFPNAVERLEPWRFERLFAFEALVTQVLLLHLAVESGAPVTASYTLKKWMWCNSNAAGLDTRGIHNLQRFSLIKYCFCKLMLHTIEWEHLHIPFSATPFATSATPGFLVGDKHHRKTKVDLFFWLFPSL